VNPVIALGLGIWLGGETVTAFEWLAAGIITVGVVLVVLGRAPALPPRARASVVAVVNASSHRQRS